MEFAVNEWASATYSVEIPTLHPTSQMSCGPGRPATPLSQHFLASLRIVQFFLVVVALLSAVECIMLKTLCTFSRTMHTDDSTHIIRNVYVTHEYKLSSFWHWKKKGKNMFSKQRCFIHEHMEHLRTLFCASGACKVPNFTCTCVCDVYDWFSIDS